MSSIRVGDITVQAIVEFESPFMPLLEMLPEATPDLVARNRDWIPERLLSQDGVANMVFQSFLVTTPKQRILIDSCVGNDKNNRRALFHQRRSDAFMQALRAAGIGPDDIDIVMCTHLHADHVGWNTRLDQQRWVPTFPKARYIFGRTEYDHWTAEHAKAPLPVYAESVLPVVEAGLAQLVEDDFQIADTLRLMPTPGHTPGHFAAVFGAGRDDVVIAGDLLHTPLQLLHPELSVAFDRDKALAAQSRRHFLETFADQPTTCCFGHFPMALNGQVKRWGTGFRCDPMG